MEHIGSCRHKRVLKFKLSVAIARRTFNQFRWLYAKLKSVHDTKFTIIFLLAKRKCVAGKNRDESFYCLLNLFPFPRYNRLKFGNVKKNWENIIAPLTKIMTSLEGMTLIAWLYNSNVVTWYLCEAK